MGTTFWKNIILVFLFFIFTPIALATSLFSLLALENAQPQIAQAEVPANLALVSNSGVRVYASLPAGLPSISGSIETKDARPEIVRQYLLRYDSPLVNYAEKIVAFADKYGLDYRLITAIAQQESNLCKKMPAGTYNCWGWGIHSAGTLGFASFDEGVEVVSRGLKEDYLDLGLVTPEQIMTKYTPLSNGSWAMGVNKFMSEME